MKTIYQLLTILLLSALVNCTKESTSFGANANGAGGSTARFTIAGNYLYVVDNVALKSFDISNNTAPVYKSKTDIGVNIETIFPYQDKLFVGSSSSMYIYSLTDPSKPKRLAKAEYTIRMSCDPVVAKDSVAYATLRSNGPCGGGQSALVVYNIKNVSKPVLEKTILLYGPYGLGIKDNALYVCEGSQGLKVYNVTNAYNPVAGVTVSATGSIFYDVIPYGNILIAQVNDGFILYDIGSNPQQPAFLSRILN
ncbi:MAG TPA: hypothetical protein VGQ04_17830 [Chitinophagaceae bacterium]|jgi:hypothetical protein|nr:hypothetical protein [Chitinophagaceae bacterium]